MTDILDLVHDVNQMVERFVRENAKPVAPVQLGLDQRCGRMFVTDNAIIVPEYNDRSVQYYGGFEYIDKEYRIELGDYVIYTDNDQRVVEALEQFAEMEAE